MCPDPSTIGKFRLSRSDQNFGCVVDGGAGAERLEFGDHRIGYQRPLRHGAELRLRRLAGRREKDEHRDDDQHWIVENAEHAKHHGEALPDGRGHFRGPRVTRSHGKQHTQHASAVHREGWDQIEQHQDDIRE